LLKHKGKQIRPSLDTTDIAVARRKLPDLRRDLEITDPELARRTLEVHIGNFFETLTGAESTVYNIRHAIELMLADWPKDAPRILTKIRKGAVNAGSRNMAISRPARSIVGFRQLRSSSNSPCMTE
jgi:hypothetical protein